MPTPPPGERVERGKDESVPQPNGGGVEGGSTRKFTLGEGEEEGAPPWERAGTENPPSLAAAAAGGAAHREGRAQQVL